jgi:hypothetical protein
MQEVCEVCNSCQLCMYASPQSSNYVAVADRVGYKVHVGLHGVLNTVFCMLEMRDDLQGFMHAQLQYTAASGVVWGLQLHEGAHLVFEVTTRDVKQIQQASHVVIFEA